MKSNHHEVIPLYCTCRQVERGCIVQCSVIMQIVYQFPTTHQEKPSCPNNIQYLKRLMNFFPIKCKVVLSAIAIDIGYVNMPYLYPVAGHTQVAI